MAIGFSTTTCLPAWAAWQVDRAMQVVGKPEHDQVDVFDIEQRPKIGEMLVQYPARSRIARHARRRRSHGNDFGPGHAAQGFVVNGRDESRADQTYADGFHISVRPELWKQAIDVPTST